MNFFLSHFFDYFLYVPVIAILGPIKGCAVMAALSMVVNFLLICLYDKTGKDWLGLETLKDGKNALTSNLPKWLQKVVSFGDVAAFIGFSVYDPLFAVIYMRKADQAFKGLSARDWKIFCLSTLVANVGWTTLIYAGLSVLRFIKAALF